MTAGGGRDDGEFLVVLRDTPWGFASELRRLVTHAALLETVELAVGHGRIGPTTSTARSGRGSMGSCSARGATAPAFPWRSTC